MKKSIKILIILCAFLLLPFGFKVAKADSQVSVSSLLELENAIKNTSITNITIAQDIEVNKTISINKASLVITSNNKTLKNVTFELNNSDLIFNCDGLNFDGSSGDYIIETKLFSRVTFSNSNFYNAKKFAFNLGNSGSTKKGVNLENVKTANNYYGGIYISGNVNLKISGTISHIEELPDNNLVALYQGNNGYVCDGKVSLGIKVEDTNATINFSSLVINNYVLKTSDNIRFYCVPYDTEAPKVNIASIITNDVKVDDTIDFSTLSVTDNRTAVENIKVEISVLGPDSQNITLSNVDAKYVNGRTFVPSLEGKYIALVVAEDGFGNKSNQRQIVFDVASKYAKPSIISKNFVNLGETGKTYSISGFSAKDYDGKSLTCTYEVKFGNNTIEISNSSFVPTQNGVYYLYVTAKDDKNQSSTKKLAINVVNYDETGTNVTVYTEDNTDSKKGCGSNICLGLISGLGLMFVLKGKKNNVK